MELNPSLWVAFEKLTKLGALTNAHTIFNEQKNKNYEQSRASCIIQITRHWTASEGSEQTKRRQFKGDGANPDNLDHRTARQCQQIKNQYLKVKHHQHPAVIQQHSLKVLVGIAHDLVPAPIQQTKSG